MTTVEEWMSDDDDDEEQSESIADHAMTLAAHAVRLAAFWNSVGPTTTDDFVDVLVAAYQLGNPEQFASVLCEVSTPDDASALDIVRAFMRRFAA